MGTLFIHRVYRTKTECVWVGRWDQDYFTGFPVSSFLTYLMEEHVVIPKLFALTVARLVQPYSEDGAKIIEAYPDSYHHASVQEMGIGLSVTGEKWTSQWPQFQWWVLDSIAEESWKTSWGCVKQEWSLEQLVSWRKKKGKRPRGLDTRAWGKLGVVRAPDGSRSKIRKK